LHSSPNIIRVMKSRSIYGRGIVARTGVKMHTGCRWGSLQGRVHFEKGGVRLGDLKGIVLRGRGLVSSGLEQRQLACCDCSCRKVRGVS
jgi:hypothetical protein